MRCAFEATVQESKAGREGHRYPKRCRSGYVRGVQVFVFQGLREITQPPGCRHFRGLKSIIHLLAPTTEYCCSGGDTHRRNNAGEGERPVWREKERQGETQEGVRAYSVDSGESCAEIVGAGGVCSNVPSPFGLKFRKKTCTAVMAAMTSEAAAAASSTAEAASAPKSTALAAEEIDFSAEAEHRGMKLISCTRVRVWR